MRHNVTAKNHKTNVKIINYYYYYVINNNDKLITNYLRRTCQLIAVAYAG